MNVLKASLFTFFITGLSFAQTSEVKVRVVDEHNQLITFANGSLVGQNKSSQGNEDGELFFSNVSYGSYSLKVSMLGYNALTTKIVVDEPSEFFTITLEAHSDVLEEVEVFGERNKKPKGLELITRLPLKPSDNIQTVSVISNKVIEDQGALTITDAVRNIPGVTLFGSYGGVKESMSTRGFRGVPVLKNGIRMDSQFQTASGVVDMQGVESIQMIKGSAAITQGVITDIGNAGGVINVVTKTPNFYNKGNVGIRYGSWNQFRPTFDVQQVLNDEGTVAMRVNGAYERADSYRDFVKSNRVYFNPSFAWKASERTTIIVEGDYFNDNRTPVTSAVNLADIGTEALYVLPNNKFLGFDTDNVNTKMNSFMARIDHELNDKLKIRAAYGSSAYEVDNMSTAANAAGKDEYVLRNRTLSRSFRDDKNTTLQFDLIGQDLYTGSVKHTAQLGFDYRTAYATNTTYGLMLGGNPFAGSIDKISIYDDYANSLADVILKDKDGNELLDKNGKPYKGSDLTFKANDAAIVSNYDMFGILAQDVVEFNKYLKGFFGLRYSEINTKDATGTKSKREKAWNPSVGVMVTPIENVNVFGSYTNSTNLRSADNRMENGEKIGASKTEQFEVGFKSEWLENRLRFNATYFHIYTSNLANQSYVPGTNTTTGYYFKAGDLVRSGLETELNGRILDNLTVMLGYAYLDARYENSPSYMNGSAPMNAPTHTANGWVQYVFNQGALNNLSVSAGLYYVGKRPVNEYNLSPDGHGNMGGTKPFDMPAYTTLNVQFGYTYKNMNMKLFLNNLTDEMGLNSYFRGGYINQIDPFNMAVSVGYSF